MTWKELKTRIRDKGYEDDTAMAEDNFESIVANASDEAVQTIYDTVVFPFKTYFIDVLEIPEEELTRPEKITVDTLDDANIGLPERTLELIANLASYLVWLDDDPVKAATYKNQYEDVKDLLITDFRRPQKVTFFGGLGW